MMPGLDGYEVCRRVRERYGSQRPYILLMTGNSKREEILKVIVAGADDYLLKPFEPLDLQIRLRLAMRVLRLQAEAPSNSPPPAIPSPVGT
jgi:DNA-binding response OmpR family regulator